MTLKPLPFTAFLLALSALAPSLPAADPIPVKTAEFPRPAKAPLGVNLEPLTDYSRSMMFVDLFKSARAFGSTDAPWDEKAPADDNGWPTTDAGVVLAAGIPVPSGDYAFACTGRCDISVVQSKAHVKNLSFDRAKNTTTATVTVDEKADSLFLAFTKTTGGIKNARLLRPGYPLNTTQTFTKEFLAAIDPFCALRLMDLTRTNETPVKEWNQRAQLTDARQSSKKGVAWEYAIQLANQTKKDLWINIPVDASDDYVAQLALLFKKSLDKDRVVYVEYSNEVWNGIFPQYHANYDAAKAEVAAGNNTLNDAGKDANTYYWGWKRVAKRIVEVSNIFKTVYANNDGGARPNAINTSVRPVLASQSAYYIMPRIQLDFIEKNYGPPSKLIYGLAGAPYIGPDPKIANKPGATVDEMLDSTRDSGMKWITEASRQYLLLARYYRVHSLCYEGGTGFDGEQNVDAKVAANRDPRIQQLVQDYLNAWYGTGGELFMYFDLASNYGKYGSWGLYEDIRKPTPKTAAITKILAAPLPPASAGAAIPGTVQAIDTSAKTGAGINTMADGTKELAFIKDDNWFEYLLNVTAPGDYNLTLQAATGADNTSFEALLSETSLGTITPKNTGGWDKYAPTPPIKVHLEKGQLVLRLRIIKGNFNLLSITLEKSP